MFINNDVGKKVQSIRQLPTSTHYRSDKCHEWALHINEQFESHSNVHLSFKKLINFLKQSRELFIFEFYKCSEIFAYQFYILLFHFSILSIEDGKTKMVCAICLKTLLAGGLMIRSCGHLFHTECILQWISEGYVYFVTSILKICLFTLSSFIRLQSKFMPGMSSYGFHDASIP